MNKLLIYFLAGSIASPALAMESKSDLHKAAGTPGSLRMVLMILAAKPVALDLKDGDGNTPLHEAAYFGCLENVEALIQAGANINACNYKGETPLDKACYAKDQSIVQLLKHYGAQQGKELNKSPSQSKLDTLLWNASEKLDYEAMLDALRRGANPNTLHVDRTGVKMTPLHKIAQTADYTTSHKFLQILLDNKANINALDSAGWTPYGRASQSADSQTGNYIGEFFEKRNAQLKMADQ